MLYGPKAGLGVAGLIRLRLWKLLFPVQLVGVGANAGKLCPLGVGGTGYKIMRARLLLRV